MYPKILIIKGYRNHYLLIIVQGTYNNEQFTIKDIVFNVSCVMWSERKHSLLRLWIWILNFFFIICASPIITHVLELVRLKQYSFSCSKFALKSFHSVLDTLTFLDSSSTWIKILMKQILTRLTVSKLTNDITR